MEKERAIDSRHADGGAQISRDVQADIPEYLPVPDIQGLRESSNRGIPISRLKQNIR
ncbi:hypothetical protein [Burkholderia lata]|uniref:hypothetical protein n=1 Tax=Burkholderia lata (strain ATCC 17760 / DSM 23089 / LMG 22485 / NCIMB 9086 / R18194 / 383) TaxID=482957 RepID=UPI0015837324|nr:hypothetical protein [Burkholderia lata]